MGVAFVRGLQGEHPRYLKVIATPKHFAAHSGPEGKRHGFDARVSLKDLHESYLPAFKACVTEGKAASVMAAYNAVNGEPAAASPTLLQSILRGEWGFGGYVVSDCGAIGDISTRHRKARCGREAAAKAVMAGCDLECGSVYPALEGAISRGLVTEEAISRSVLRLFEARMRLGMFARGGEVPYDSLGPGVIDCERHRGQALEASRRSLVLLKNEGILPLAGSMRTLAVIGPNADSLAVLLGSYNGRPSRHTTVLEGLRRRFSGSTTYAKGCELRGMDRRGLAKAISLAREADAVVLCLGLSPQLEGEEGDAFNAEAAGDKASLRLPGLQEELLDLVADTGTPLVVVLLSGGPMDLRRVDARAAAVLQAWYPGQDGGQAVAEVLFGDHNPAGRLPVTFVMGDEDLPPFEEYAMKGRGYRYLERKPLYPFGFGLGYGAFDYADLRLSVEEGAGEGSVRASVRVRNSGSRPGHEVTQFYLRRHGAPLPLPHHQLCAFARHWLEAGEERTVEVRIPFARFDYVDEEGTERREPGAFTLFAGGQQPDERSAELTGTTVEARDLSLRVDSGNYVIETGKE
jgi:beta-glucosidase